MKKTKKNPSKLMNIPCHDCVTQSVPDCGKCRLIKKNDLVEALTSKVRVHLDEDGRNNEGRPEKLTDTEQYYLAISVHMGDSFEKAGAKYKVSKATAHRVYARYKDGFGTPRRVVKRRSPRKSPNSQSAG